MGRTHSYESVLCQLKFGLSVLKHDEKEESSCCTESRKQCSNWPGTMHLRAMLPVLLADAVQKKESRKKTKKEEQKEESKESK